MSIEKKRYNDYIKKFKLKINQNNKIIKDCKIENRVAKRRIRGVKKCYGIYEIQIKEHYDT